MKLPQWKDRKGNTLTLMTPMAFYPTLEQEHAKREDIEAKMKQDEAAFQEASDETLVKWVGDFSGKSVETSAMTAVEIPSLEAARVIDFGTGTRMGAFFKPKAGTWRYAEFRFAQEAKGKDAERLMRQFLAAIQVEKVKAGGKDAGVTFEGKWMTMTVPGYLFKTDLSKSQGQAFVKSAGRMMEAMLAAYRRYVPPQKEMKISTIRVFATREGYNEYMKGATGESGERTIGLWSPSHEELLILDQGNSERAETLKTMRHEAFHQYLFYATGKGNHALWFNEGHACFFENITYDAKKNYVRINDDPRDRRPARVATDPEKYARMVKEILSLDHEAFYAGDLMLVNDRYTAAWAAVYFLAKGSHAFKEFADYQSVIPTYLKEMADGKNAQEATEIAWEGVKGRDFVADFLKFWGKRGAARNYEP